MKKLLLIPLLLLAACSNNPQGTAPAGPSSTDTVTATVDSVSSPSEEEPMEEAVPTETETSKEGEPVSSSIVPYDQEDPQFTDYNRELYDELKGTKPFVVFFHAEWCILCRQVEQDITAAIGDFPKGTKILKADFDREKALRREFDVLLQSTLVVFNKEGEEIARLSTPDNETLIATIDESL